MRYLELRAYKKAPMRVDLLAVFLGGCVLGFLAGVYIWGVKWKHFMRLMKNIELHFKCMKMESVSWSIPRLAR